MTLALIALVAALQVATLVVVLRKKKSLAAERHELGTQYAQLAVAYAATKGGTPLEQRRHALAAFRLADETADGKRDFTDAQTAVYLDAVEREGKA